MLHFRHFLVCLGLFFTPIFVWPSWGDSIREPKLYLLLAVGSLVGVLQLGDARRSLVLWQGIPRSFLFFIVYAVMQSIVMRPLSLALWDGFVLLATLCLVLEFTNDQKINHIDFCLRCLTWFSLAYGTLQFIGIDPVFSQYDPNVSRIPTGFLGHRTLFGPFLVMLMAYHLPFRRYNLVVLCLLLAAAAQSAMTMFSALACFLVFWAIRRRYCLLGIILTTSTMVGVIGFMHRERFEFFAEKGRFLAWQMTFQEAMSAPLFGHGFNTFSNIFGVKYQLVMVRPWIHAHHELLQVFFELGMVGVFFVSWMFSDFFCSIKKALLTPYKEGWLLVCVVGMADSLGNFPLHIAPLALFSLCGWMLTAQQSQMEPVTLSRQIR